MTEVTPKQIFKMQNDINFLKKNSYAQARDTLEIKNYLLGDKYHKGLKDQIKEDKAEIDQQTAKNSEDIENLKASHLKIKYYVAAMISILGVGATIFAIASNWVKIFG